METVEVVGISIFPPFQGYGIILRELKDGGRWIPIFIGPAEAQTISMLLRMVKHERPLTFDMFQSVLDAADIHVDRVNVTDLRNNTFYAEIQLRREEVIKRIDARPSDAIALALKTGAPIFINEQILTDAGFTGEIGESAMGETEPKIEPTAPEDLRTLQQKLDELVAQERYEEAAAIRDKIRILNNLEENKS